MANYKFLYEQAKKMLETYQDTIVPKYRDEIVPKLLAETENLRAELRDERDRFDRLTSFELSERAELERVKAELDAAVALVKEWEQFRTFLLVHGFTNTPDEWHGKEA